MAKSRHRSTSRRETAFYEAMPAIPAVGAWTPEIPGQTRIALETLAEIARSLWVSLRPLPKRLLTGLNVAGLSTFEAVLRGGRQARFALRYTTDATATYVPSLSADFAARSLRTARRLAGHRARGLYLVAIGIGVIALGTMGTLAATATLRAYAADISSPAALLAKKQTGITITDRNGQVLFEGYGASPSQPISLTDMPKTLKNATLAAEDPGFYDHSGFSWRGTIRAAVTDITHQSTVEGGSTLTQQLVKNALLTSDKNITRKLKEMLLASALEKRYSKDEILEMYLNQTYYGEGASGVEVASQTYFHKPADQLTLGESALLAGLPLGPSRFDPNVDLAAAIGRRDYVLSRMLSLNMISPAEAKAARAEALVLADPAAPAPGVQIYAKTVTILAPHFVFYVLDQLRAKFGDDVVENGGLRVQTTLDLTKQNLAQADVTTHINALADHHVTNGGLVSLDPRTGDVLAMVGSTDYNAPGFGNVNVTLSDLQPGSSFKPIAYVTAFKKGYTGATTVQDEPVSFPTGDGTLYTPQNYDLKFHGTVTLRHALDNSLNIPAVKVLQFAGIHDTIQTAHDLGITTLQDESRYGLSLVLGGGEVRPIDMATVYGTFANAGVKVEPRSILKVSDRYGKDITPAATTTPQTAIDPRIAYMITSILADDSSRQPEFPAFGPLTLPGRTVAAKTGTTNDFRDNWTVGYTPSLVTAVWVGNNDHSAMINVDGITGAAPIWHDYMLGALAGTPSETFPAPAGITVAKVCSSGGLANPWDGGYNEVFMTGALPTSHCATQPPAPIDPASSPTPFTFPITWTFPQINIPTTPPIKPKH